MDDIHRYVGRAVELIYLDRKNIITQRKVLVHSIKGDRVRAYCLDRCAPRMFITANILAVHPVARNETG